MAARSPKASQCTESIVTRRWNVADKGRNADVRGHVPDARGHSGILVLFQKSAAVLVVYGCHVDAATCTIVQAARMPKRHGVVLYQLASCRAQRLQHVIACGNAVGPGKKVQSTMAGRQSVVGVYDFPRHPTAFPAKQIVAF